MAPHSSTLAWKIPWTEGPGGLQSMGSLRVRHDWATSLSLFTFMHRRRKWQPTPGFLPGESQGRGAWWVAVYGVAQSRTRLKWLSSSSSSSYLQSHNFLWKTNQCDLFSSCTTNLKCMPLRYVQGCWSLIGWGLLVGLSIPMGSGSATEAWRRRWGMPWCSVVENPPANAQDMGLIPGLGRFHMLRSS